MGAVILSDVILNLTAVEIELSFKSTVDANFTKSFRKYAA